MRIGILLAMDRERDAAVAVLGGQEGVLAGNTIRIATSGMGKVNAAIATTRLILEFKPDCIISSGCAGGLAPDVRQMSIVVSSEVCYHDVWCGEGNEPGQVQGLPARFASDPQLYRKALETKCGAVIHGGLICSGDLFVDSVEAARGILAANPEAIAVDMESGAIAQTCYRAGVPFISLRVISDTVTADDRTAQYEGFWNDIADNSFDFLKTFLEKL